MIGSLGTCYFNPRAPCGARRESLLLRRKLHDFNPRAPCGARHRRPVYRPCHRSISIHAPRVGRDCSRPASSGRPSDFNPRAPCGARRSIADKQEYHNEFQSTRPVWGATAGTAARSVKKNNFNPRAPCGARPWAAFVASSRVMISIHAPRVGRDYLVLDEVDLGTVISIHAPRVGRDGYEQPTLANKLNFNPRAPCGARPMFRQAQQMAQGFQSTRPVWGATFMSFIAERNPDYFNPRAPCGARLRVR